MKKSIVAFLFSGAVLFSSCETEAVLDSAEVQKIVDAAVAAALQNYPNTQTIADAAAAAATTAVNNGLGALDIDGAIQAALDAADALSNPTVSRVGTGGVTSITSNTTWTNDKVWLMDGKIVVENGATLTIEEGTIVKAASGTGANATVLIIAKGGKINAVGTADKPIIFTDANDQIVYANGSTSPNRSVTDKGLWGSVIILGNGIVGAANGEANIEGVVSGYEFTKYGGSNNAESSGTMKYVSIRHTGTAVSPGNELQGLTMGGVGSGTVIENIELIGSEDDGIEIFGGAVNVTNIVIANFDDDGIDLDQAYDGTISNAVVIMAPGSDTVFEIDGTEEPNDAILGEYTVKNVTAYGRSDAAKFDTFGNWKSDATGFNENVLFVDFPASTTLGGIDADTYDGAGTAPIEGKLNFKDFVVVTSDSKSDVINGQVSEDSATWISVSTTRPAGKGANETVFAWTQFFN
jgi:Flp pilus assembly protein TadG